MVTGAEIISAAQGLKTAFDLLQGLNATAREAAINEVKVELTRHILEAQQALTAAGVSQADAAQRIRDLEQQVVSLENWEREKERYQLTAIGAVAVAYTHKPGMENGEPMHWLCQPCFDKGHKSALQYSGTATTDRGRGIMTEWSCIPCGNKIRAGRNATLCDPSTW